MSTERGVEGAGCVAWWGFGPARDLLSTDIHDVRTSGKMDVLLVGSGDPRHILKTIAGLKDTDVLHVWVIENSMEVVARQLLLLYISLYNFECMNLHKKAEMFLELFGNSEIRSETEETLKRVAAQLSLSVTDSLSSDTCFHPCLDTSALKFTEKDKLVEIFSGWEQSLLPSESASKFWDARVRKHLGTRYDARHGCYDWDLTMKLHQRGCDIINKNEYAKWRDGGVAFDMREGLYTTSNQSLFSTRVFSHRGDKIAVKGYWGDIVSSPYLAFGVETENNDLLKKQNNQHVKTAQDISGINVLALFESLANRCSASNDDTLSAEQIDTNSSFVPATPDLLIVKGVKVSFLSLETLPKLHLKDSYRNLFNTIYCSASMVHLLNASLRQSAKPDAILVVELVRFILDLTTQQIIDFSMRVNEIAEDSGFIATQDQSSDIYAIFNKKQ